MPNVALNYQNFFNGDENIDVISRIVPENTSIVAGEIVNKGAAVGEISKIINSPLGIAASKTFGGANGFTVTADEVGNEGNEITVAFVAGTGNNVAMSAVKAGDSITVTLGTDGAGALDATKNTGILIAAAIDALTDVHAVIAGDGTGVISAAANAVNLAGGIDSTIMNAYGIALEDVTTGAGETASVPVLVDGPFSTDKTVFPLGTAIADYEMPMRTLGIIFIDVVNSEIVR